MSILIVDDSPHVRMVFEAYLKGAGYTELLTAASAREAFQHLGMENSNGVAPEVDLILMDIVMPEMDGVEACRRIKATPMLENIPIIMVTGQDEVKYLDEAFTAGAMDYITKSVKSVELLARVRSAWTLKREMDRREHSHINELEGKNRELELAFIELETKHQKLEQETLRLKMLRSRPPKRVNAG